MKTPRTLQTKRTRPKKGFRMMHAATRSTKKRKQRASTTAAPADLGEVSGVGVPLALVVILLLHVAAIAGIWIHDKWTESADLEATKVALKGDTPPQRITSLDFHLVSSGDTIGSIAREYGVSQESLMNANEGIGEYVAGWKINIPAARKTNVGPAEAIAGGNNVEDEPLKFTPQSRPLIQTSDDESIPGSRPGDLVEVGGSETGRIEQAVLIRPVSPVRIDPASPNQVASGARQHVVESGDTLWGIAKNNKVTVDQLKRANPKVNTNALKIGAKLIIPSSR
ncbi:MAG: LysM peptidoglycan-binding domain-containing protein [Akkermansiaceae bacterium]|nr:LysM peptidoglycan-binding domain-containing protein [Akkermansiaceae bacterium]